MMFFHLKQKKVIIGDLLWYKRNISYFRTCQILENNKENFRIKGRFILSLETTPKDTHVWSFHREWVSD